MGRLRRLLAAVVTLIGLMALVACLPTTPASTDIDLPVPATGSAPPSGDEPPLQVVFTSPGFATVLWPIAFVVLEFVLSKLASMNPVRPRGRRKYRVWYQDPGGHRVETSPVSVDWLKREINNHNIEDIEILPSVTLESFSLGIDLCVGVLLTDLMLIFGFLKAAPSGDLRTFLTITTSLFILHIIAVLLTVLVVSSWTHHDQAHVRRRGALLSNFIGILAMISLCVSLSIS